MAPNKRRSNKRKVIEEQPSEEEWAVDAILKWKRDPITHERFFEILYAPTSYSRVFWNETGRANAVENKWAYEEPEEGSSEKIKIRWKAMWEPESNLDCPKLIKEFTSKNPKPWDDDDDEDVNSVASEDDKVVSNEDAGVAVSDDDFKDKVKVKDQDDSTDDSTDDSMDDLKVDSNEKVKEESTSVADQSASSVTKYPRSAKRIHKPLTNSGALRLMLKQNDLTGKRKRYDGTNGTVNFDLATSLPRGVQMRKPSKRSKHH